MRRRLAPALVVALAALVLGVPSASATFHLMQIREVYPGSLAHPESEYVELQMWAPGQNQVANAKPGEGKALHLYNAAGTEVAKAEFPADVANAGNQATLVLATPLADSDFHIVPDAELPAADTLDPSGGKVCWVNIDCVTWGNYTGSSGQPSPTGTPAPAIPNEMALRRSIQPGCPTLLEQSDDHDNSASDFFFAAPGPRPNSVAPSEVPCSGAPLEEGLEPPQTTLNRKPAKRSRDRTPTFTFASDQLNTTFECSLDGHGFHPCRSPFTPKPLKPGPHRFSVRAVGPEGDLDRSPASYAFKILPPRHHCRKRCAT
jgi:hypothetical protein